ncbi:MAG TPA: hypothetical protein DCE42_26010 [Myxococcales bacterium]|nr:hypothetical protein [Deltaproteobacteria bacterium]HAA58246.1 hypothetical protein [Myxococcales bacterium]|tara:strand:+ start:6350 stop:6862 length:513 start_codon:yes stop_codon:yes gene_type:complete
MRRKLRYFYLLSALCFFLTAKTGCFCVGECWQEGVCGAGSILYVQFVISKDMPVGKYRFTIQFDDHPSETCIFEKKQYLSNVYHEFPGACFAFGGLEVNLSEKEWDEGSGYEVWASAGAHKMKLGIRKDNLLLFEETKENIGYLTIGNPICLESCQRGTVRFDLSKLTKK